MGKSLVYSFDYMLADELCATVWVYDDKSVEFKNYAERNIKKPFGVRTEVTLEDVEEFFEYRCFPRTRANCKELLKSGGFDFYCPEMIVRKTKGRMSDDEFWIRFHDDV